MLVYKFLLWYFANSNDNIHLGCYFLNLSDRFHWSMLLSPPLGIVVRVSGAVIQWPVVHSMALCDWPENQGHENT